MSGPVLTELLLSHGHKSECKRIAKYLNCSKDLIFLRLNERDFQGVLDAINLVTDAKERYELARIFMPSLLQIIPEQTIALLQSNNFRTLELNQLVPSFLDSPVNSNKDVLDFLTVYCEQSRRGQSVALKNLAFYKLVKSHNVDQMIVYLQEMEKAFMSGQLYS